MTGEPTPSEAQLTWAGRLTGLWRHRDFMRLWAGQTISEFGSWLGALSLLAILFLNATPAQMGLFETLRSLPALLIGLFAGVWVDRLRRRPILVAADIARALLLGAVVLVAFLGLLKMTHLYLIVFLVGGLTIVFNIAYQAYIPGLVKRSELVEANSKLGATASLAEMAGPGLGGLLVQIFSAPFALLLDAISFVISAAFVSLIRSPESPPTDRQERQAVRRDVATGLRLVLGHHLLRALAAATGTRSFFGGFFAALYGVYVLREIGLSPAVLGLLIGIGGLGALFGAMVTGRVTKRLGLGNSLIISMFVSSLFTLLIPLAAGPKLVAILLLLVSQIAGDAAATVYDIGQLTLRQSITPDNLLGRVNASFEFLVAGVGTLGILTGGLLGQFIGLRPATAVAAAGTLLACLWLLFSPLRGLADLAGWQLQAGADGKPAK